MSQQFQRGDIILVRFPFTDLSGSKRRPAIVLAEYPPDVIVAFISSVLPKVSESADILLQPSSPHFSVTGLKKASVIRLRKLATLERALVTRRLGKVHQSLLTAVDNALITGLGIDINHIVEVEYRRLAKMLQEQGEKIVLSYVQSKA